MKKRNIGTIICYIVLFLLLVMCLVPFYNLFINATHDNAAISTGYHLLPGKYLVENYQLLTNTINLWRAFANSLFIAVSCTALSCYFGALTAYGLAKFNFRFNRFFLWIILLSMMVPSQLGIIGYYELMIKFGLLNKHASLIIPSIANTGTVFFIRQYIVSSLPDSLLESARIDGCHEVAIFHKIALPIISPAIFTQAIFCFIGSWNNFMSPLILLFSDDKLTLPIVIQRMQGIYTRELGAMNLGLAISVVPIIIFASFFLKRIVGGLTVGAVKG